MASSGSHDSPPARRNSGSQLLQELEALSQSLYMSQQPLAPRRGGSLSMPNAKNLRLTRDEHAALDEAIPLPGLTNARHNSRAVTESRNIRHSISHPQPVESKGMGVKDARYSSSGTSGISSEKADIRGRRHQYSLSPFRRRKGEELNRADDERNILCAHQEEEEVDFSKKMEHKSAFWTWKPIRALSHIGMHRFNCIFSVYVNAIRGLSPSVNGLRLAVNLRRKESRDGAVQTMPARVFQSVAEFDESLRIHCHVYGSNSHRHNSHGIMKFQSRPFTIFVVAVDAEELDFGKHHVDLGTLLQEAVHKHPAGEDSDDGWNASFALSGKARGAELVVGLGYEILDKDERYHIGSCRFKDYPDHQTGKSPWGISKSLPNSLRGTPKTLAAQGFPGGVYSSGSPFQTSQMDGEDPVDFVRMAHLNLDDPDLTAESVLHSQMFQNENLPLNGRSEGANVGLREVHEQENSRISDIAVNHPSEQEIENADDEGYFEVEEQGVELAENEVVEDETATTNSEQLDKEGTGSGGHEVVKEVIEEASQRRLIELDSIAQQISVLESVIVDKTASQVSAMEPLGNQDSQDYKIHNDIAVKSDQNIDEVLMDDEAGAVEGEFLHMLESDEIDLDSHENMALKDGAADSEDDMDQLTSILAELAETELKQMSHDSGSKARAKELDIEENEALMQKWGLNEKEFKKSPQNSGAIVNFFDGAMKKQIKRSPDLGDGLGSHVVHVQTRDGGMLASMNPAHFRSGGRLVMHVSKPVVLPAEMGDTAVEILQKMAGLGTTNMTSQVIDCMPLDNITGKSVEQIAFEGMASAITKNGFSEQNANLKDQAGKGSLLSKGFGTIMAGSQKSKAAGLHSRGNISLDECVSLDNLVSLAMQRIEAMALEGLKIQAEMADEEAPYSIPPVPLAKQSKINRNDGITNSNSSNSNRLMAMAISLEEWMGLDSGLYDVVVTNENTRAILAAHHALKHQDLQAFADKQKKTEGEGCMGNSLTVALLVQLRDPLRNYEAVGCPMIGLVEAERVVVPCGSNKKLAEEEWDLPRFKIKGVHISGLKIDEKKRLQRAIWGSQQHQYQKSTASKWLIANGLAKNNRHTNSFLKSKAQQHLTNNIKAGEFVWSISSRLNSSGTGAATVHHRNPDIVIPNQALLRRV